MRRKIRAWKVTFYLLFFALLAIVFIQNSHPVAVQLLFWQVELPLVVLLLGGLLSGALLCFVAVLFTGR